MQPVERPLGFKGKVWVVIFAALALGITIRGLFSVKTIALGPLTLPREVFPLLIFAAIGGVVFSVLLSLGKERCRFCKAPLVEHRRLFPPAVLVPLAEAIETERCEALPDVAPPDEELPGADPDRLVMVVATCPEPCVRAGTVELIHERGSVDRVLVDRRTLAGPTVRAFRKAVG